MERGRKRAILALVACGVGGHLWMSRPGRERANTDGWRWRDVAPMAQARRGVRLVTLADGHVLACGGSDDKYQILRSCEIYDPGADRWRPAAALEPPHTAGLMTRLADGRVLVVGGTTGSGPDAETPAALYDPARDRWTTVASLPRPATIATLTALPSGEALLVGGAYLAKDVFADTYVFDPATARWRVGPRLRHGRGGHCSAWTSDGLLVAGGQAQYEPCWPSSVLCWRGGTSPPLASVERLGPDQQWRRGRSAPVPLPYCHTTSLGPDQVLATSDTDDRTALYHASRDRWRAITAPARSLSERAIAPLPGGGAIAAAGYPHREAPNYSSSLVLAPGARTWRWGPAIAHARTGATAIALPDGRVLLAGGSEGHARALAWVELFAP